MMDNSVNDRDGDIIIKKNSSLLVKSLFVVRIIDWHGKVKGVNESETKKELANIT